MINLQENEKFTMNGDEYIFVKLSEKNGGQTHFWAHSINNGKLTQIAIESYEDAKASELIEECEFAGLNVRYQAFKVINPNGKNYEFMDFINQCIAMYLGRDRQPNDVISDHDDFTRFIVKSVSHQI